MISKKEVLIKFYVDLINTLRAWTGVTSCKVMAGELGELGQWTLVPRILV